MFLLCSSCEIKASSSTLYAVCTMAAVLSKFTTCLSWLCKALKVKDLCHILFQNSSQNYTYNIIEQTKMALKYKIKNIMFLIRKEIMIFIQYSLCRWDEINVNIQSLNKY